MELVIQPLGRILNVKHGDNLLAVLREHQLPVSYSCTAGRCGTCRCKLLRGQVAEARPDASAGASADDGYVLACMTSLTESCEIEIAEPDEVVTHPARIVKASV